MLQIFPNFLQQNYLNWRPRYFWNLWFEPRPSVWTSEFKKFTQFVFFKCTGFRDTWAGKTIWTNATLFSSDIKKIWNTTQNKWLWWDPVSPTRSIGISIVCYFLLTSEIPEQIIYLFSKSSTTMNVAKKTSAMKIPFVL